MEKIQILAEFVEKHWSNDPEQAIAYGREALALMALHPDHALERRILYQKGNAHYIVSEYDSVLTHARRLDDLARRTRAPTGQAQAASLIGRVHRRKGDYERAHASYLRALELYERIPDQPGVANTLDKIGLVFRNLGDYDQALDFHMRALEIDEELGDEHAIAIVNNNIGHVHRNLGSYDQALDFYGRALRSKEALNDKRGVAITIFSIGDVEVLRGNDEAALDFFLRALEIDEALGDKHGIAITLRQIGEAYHSLGNLDAALSYFLRAQELFERIGDKSGVAMALTSTSNIYMLLGNSDKALSTTMQALAVAEQIEAQRLIRDAYATLASIYEERNQFEEALAAQKQYKVAHDSLFNSESQSVISELQTQYRTKEQYQEIELLRHQRQIQQLWLGGLVVGLMLLAVVVFLVYSRYRLKHRANRALSEANTTLEDSMRRLTETQDRLIHAEKMASLGTMTAGIAHEIKNPLNFVNNFAKLSIELADELHQALDQHDDKRVADIRGQIDDLLSDLAFNASKIDEHSQRADNIVRSMMLHSGIKHSERQMIDLQQLIEESVDLAYAGLRARVPGFDVAMAYAHDANIGEVEVVPQEMGRVLRNLMNNAFDAVHELAQTAGHVYRAQVAVSTTLNDGFVEIRISDNGTGIAGDMRDQIFDPFFTTKAAGSATGLGLSLAHEIVVQGHGGRLTLEHTVDDGATFLVTLPLEQRASFAS